MDSIVPASDGKPTTDARERLPNKRSCETVSFERNNLRFRMTVGAYPDGRPGEIFLSAEHSNSFLDALKRDGQGIAASPIGAAVDLIT